MTDFRTILHGIDNIPCEILLRPPPKKSSSPIPSKNLYDDSPNKSFDKENFFETNTFKTISFNSFKQELDIYKKFDEIPDKDQLESFESEEKFKILLEQNLRLIEIINEINEEKERITHKYEVLEKNFNKKLDEITKENEGFISRNEQLKEGFIEIKAVFMRKMQETIKEKEEINDELKEKNMGLSDKIVCFEEELRYKEEIIEKLEEKLKDNNDLEEEQERLTSLSEEKERQIKFLQEKLTENEDFHSKLLKKTDKLKNYKENANLKESQFLGENECLKKKILESQKEVNNLKNKYQILFKESNERIKTLSNYYEQSQKSFENEIEKTYEEEKNRIMNCLVEERKENKVVITRLEEKIKNSEKEMNELKENINVELEDLGRKYNQQQEKYKDKEGMLVKENSRLNVKFLCVLSFFVFLSFFL